MFIQKKIIFISGNPISNQVGEKINPFWYEVKGFNVEYWNLCELYFTKEALASYFCGHEKYYFRFSNERKFLTKSEVSQALEGMSSNVVFCHIDFNSLDDFWLRRLFKRFSIQYYVGPRRTAERNSGLKKSLFKSGFLFKKIISAMRKRLKYTHIKMQLSNFIYRHTDFYQKPTFVAGSGLYGRNELLSMTKSRHYISVPSNDLEWKYVPNLINEPYCVFVDDGVLYSPDKNLNSGKKQTTSSVRNYSDSINRVFDLVENTLNVKVVIAASFKFDYKNNDIFGNRDIFYGKTNQLIQHSNLVLGHSSSATWQALVNFKPIILLLDSSFNEKNIATTIAAAFLGLIPIDSAKLNATDVKGVIVNREHYNKLVECFFCERNLTSTAKDLIVAALRKFVFFEK